MSAPDPPRARTTSAYKAADTMIVPAQMRSHRSGIALTTAPLECRADQRCRHMRSPVSGIHVQPPQLELRPLTHQVPRNSDNAHQCTSVMSAPDASAFHRMARRHVAPNPGLMRQFAYYTKTCKLRCFDDHITHTVPVGYRIP